MTDIDKELKAKRAELSTLHGEIMAARGELDELKAKKSAVAAAITEGQGQLWKSMNDQKGT